MRCPACQEPAPADANWCEACGADLHAEPPVPCVACGQLDVADDGYCMSCGHKQPDARDRVEIDDGVVVAVSDRGLRHQHNEDAIAVAPLPGGGAVLVVCDGVSSTPGSATASEAAAVAARDVAVTVLADGDDALTADRVERALAAATEAAHDGAEQAANGPTSAAGPPSSTIVTALAVPQSDGTTIGVGWLGDSRAYWLDGESAALLTRDHEIDGSLTRWIGADSGRLPPSVKIEQVTGPGLLVACSDGLWRYAERPDELQALVERLVDRETGTGTIGLARALVGHAIDSGGHDNISVALWPSTTPESDSDE